ncbi:MAG: hypothetical protein HYX68_05000 [Planctomycetes bacterium]|jgi:hypothetical protein|nr:hypothetical protein [Planctomycetota bacterium]
MRTVAPIARRLAELVRRRNAEIGWDAILKASLGIIFTLVTFTVFFWFSWFAGFLLGVYLGLQAWQFATIFTGLFFIAATWSAWLRIDPLTDLQPLSDDEQMVTLIGAAVGLSTFSPRHASAGFAFVLIGGPAGVIEAYGIWAHRLRADSRLIDEAARLLQSCDPVLPVNEVRNLAAAFLLRRLALIKVVPHEDSHALTLTEKGNKVISRGTSKVKRTPEDKPGQGDR